VIVVDIAAVAVPVERSADAAGVDDDGVLGLRVLGLVLVGVEFVCGNLRDCVEDWDV
jgi:hypothetical protein